MTKGKLLILLICLSPFTVSANDDFTINSWKRLLRQFFNEPGVVNTPVSFKKELSNTEQELFMSLNDSPVTYSGFLDASSEDINKLLATYIGKWTASSHPELVSSLHDYTSIVGNVCNDEDILTLKEANRVQLTKTTNDELNNYDCVVLDIEMHKDPDISNFKGKFFFLVNKTTNQYLEMFINHETYSMISISLLDNKKEPEHIHYTFTKGYLKNVIRSNDKIEAPKSGGSVVAVPVVYYKEVFRTHNTIELDEDTNQYVSIPYRTSVYKMHESLQTGNTNDFIRKITIDDANRVNINTVQLITEIYVGSIHPALRKISTNLDTATMTGPRIFGKNVSDNFNKLK